MSEPKRVIAHLDCDAFFAAVELLQRPQLRGLPVIVADDGPRSVVTTASYEARKFGVGSAMSAVKARRRCPQAIVIRPNFDRYREVSQHVWAIVAAQLPSLQQAGLDEAYSDLTEVKRPLPLLRAVIAAVLEQTGIQISAGIAPNRLIAKIASDLDKPAGFVALGREQAAKLLATRSVRLLPGIGPRTEQRLVALGARTVGDLQALPAELLTAQFGPRHGSELKRRAFFDDDSPVLAPRAAKSRSKERTYDVDVTEQAVLAATVRTMAIELAAELRKRNLLAGNVAIKLRLDTFATITRARTLPAATDADEVVAKTALRLLAANAPQRPVRLIGVRVAAFTDRAREQRRLSTVARGPEQLRLPL